MTGGRVKRIERYIEGDTFLVTYGDGVSDVDIRKLVAFHRGHGQDRDGDGRAAAVALRRPRPRRRATGARSSPKSRRLEGWVSARLLRLQPPVFDYLDGDDCSWSASRWNAWPQRVS